MFPDGRLEVCFTVLLVGHDSHVARSIGMDLKEFQARKRKRDRKRMDALDRAAQLNGSQRIKVVPGELLSLAERETLSMGWVRGLRERGKL